MGLGLGAVLFSHLVRRLIVHLVGVVDFQFSLVDVTLE